MDSTTEGNGVAGKVRTPSRAALTHQLRKMKSKMTKCKQCDNYIVVNGIECEEVGSRRGRDKPIQLAIVRRVDRYCNFS